MRAVLLCAAALAALPPCAAFVSPARSGRRALALPRPSAVEPEAAKLIIQQLTELVTSSSPSAALGVSESELLMGAALGSAGIGGLAGRAGDRAKFLAEIERAQEEKAALEAKIEELQGYFEEQERQFEMQTGELQKGFEVKTKRKLAEQKEKMEKKRLADMQAARSIFDEEKEKVVQALAAAEKRVAELEAKIGPRTFWDDGAEFLEGLYFGTGGKKKKSA